VLSTFEGQIEIIIGEYSLEKGQYLIGKKYFTGTIVNSGKIFMPSLISVSYKDLIQKRVGIFLKPSKEILVEKVQFYKKIEQLKINEETGQEESVIAYPGGPLYSFARTLYYYYDPN
jgi:hypothetical protein